MSAIETDENDSRNDPSEMEKEELIRSCWGEYVRQFDEMNLKPDLLKGIFVYGLEKPTSFQQRAIVPCVRGYDVIAQTATGADRITSMCISVVQRIRDDLSECQALILVPKQDQAQEIRNILSALARFMEDTRFDDCTEDEMIDEDAQVIVGTPASVCALMVRGLLKVDHVKVLVLADNKLFREFNDEMVKVLKRLSGSVQILLFTSSERNQHVFRLSKEYMRSRLDILMKKETSSMEDWTRLRHYLTRHSEVFKSLENTAAFTSNGDELANQFSNMNLNEDLRKGIAACGFEKPTEVQKRAISACTRGLDTIIQSGRGTGKSTAASISILQLIDTSVNECQALVLAPTCELVRKIEKILLSLADSMQNVKCCTCVVDDEDVQIGDVRVVLGTPACVYETIDCGLIRTENIKVIVLDNGTELFLPSYKHQVEMIMRQLPFEVQLILVSVPVPKYVLTSSKLLMRNPVQTVTLKEKHTNSKTSNKIIQIKANDDSVSIPAQRTQQPSVKTFEDMNLKPNLLSGIYNYGIEKPRLIHQRVIPPLIKGHSIELLAEEGTGRTTAVCISVLQRIDTSLAECQALILMPSRNFGQETHNIITSLSCLVDNCICHVYNGRMNLPDDLKRVKSSAQIVIGTPHRIYDMIVYKPMKMDYVKILVLDGISELLSRGLEDIVYKIMKYLPSTVQTVLISNKPPDVVFFDKVKGTEKFARNPVRITVGKEGLNLDDWTELKRNTARGDEFGSFFHGMNEEDMTSYWYETTEDFADMNLREELLKGIETCNYQKPTTVQQEAIMPCADGRDVILLAQPGSGKTTAVCISVLQQMDASIKKCQALFITRTREMAQQIHTEMLALSSFMEKFDSYVLIGGTSIREDMKRLAEGVQLVIGTPGRIYDMISRNSLKLDRTKTFVLDEGSPLLSGDFAERIFKILQHLSNDSQIILVSSTMPQNVTEICKQIMSKPIEISVGNEQSCIPENIKQFYVSMKRKGKLQKTLNLLSTLDDNIQIIIFCNTKLEVNWLEVHLKDSDCTSVSPLYSDMNSRKREEVLEHFRIGRCRTLITTDALVGRKEDRPVTLIINHDFPPNWESYFHRICFGGIQNPKVVLSFVTNEQEHTILNEITKYYNICVSEMPENIAHFF